MMAQPAMIDLHPEGARHAVIWLHGLGDSGAGLAPLVDALDLPTDLPVRHLLPDAPERPITINMGYKMRGWYDIRSFEDPAERAVESHVRESATQITALLDRLVTEGFAPERIVLAGFSQGGVIASFTALRYPAMLAGLLCMSTYLAVPDALAGEMSEAARTHPADLLHARHLRRCGEPVAGLGCQEPTGGGGALPRVARVPHAPRDLPTAAR